MSYPNEKQQRRSLLGLMITQFFGAFNDNAWKVMVFTLATRPLLNQVSEGGVSFESSSQLLATYSFLIFLIPMMLFSLPAGSIADQTSKRRVIIFTKVLEVLLMGACALSLYFAPTHLLTPFILLGMMGAQSALFGPAKYGIIPELLPKEKLSSGNGILEMWTMIAIIVGTGVGPILLGFDKGGLLPSLTWLGPLALTALSAIGLIGSFLIHKVPAAQENKQKISASLKSAWRTIKGDRTLFFGIFGAALYWLMTTLLGQNILVYAKTLVLGLEKGEMMQGIPLASYGIGIAMGALFSGKMSGNRIEYGLIPLGSIGFAITSLILGIIQPAMAGTVALLLVMGMSSGLLIVPLHAIVQFRAPDKERGSIIALGNFFDIVGMVIGSSVAGVMAFAGFGLKTMLMVSAIGVLIATIYCIRNLPKFLVRLLVIILTRTVYKIRKIGFENLPKEGAVLLVSNHISIIDALFVIASIDRPVRFIVNDFYYNKWCIHPLAKLMDAIPVSSTTSTKVLLKGMGKASEALDNGEVVCIFPEGQVSHTGKLLPFRRGVEIITRGRECPIIPLYLGNVWGSIFSFYKGKFFKKWPQKSLYSLKIFFGKALPSNTPATKLRQTIQEMECDAWMDKKEQSSPIHHLFIKSTRKNPFRLTVADQNKKLPGWKVLLNSIAIARELRSCWKEQTHIGIFIPNSINSTLINIATTLSGKVAINLNYERFKGEIDQAEIQTVITSRHFLEDAGLDLPSKLKIVYIEDLINKMTLQKKVGALLIGLFTPISSIENYCGAQNELKVDDPLTIIFSSGTTDKPKGVLLSHFNVASNVESTSQVLPYLNKRKNILASLPLFHSFGFITMWLSLSHKIGLITHSNPREYKVVGELAKKYEVKLMISTPPLLNEYIKQILPEQFGSLEYIITGGEKLPKQTSEAFENQFGICPTEGYGATECSPVIATSTMDVREAGIYQVGTIYGSVGQTVPGVIAKVVNPTTFETLPNDTEGLLLVKGPNIMKGYLNDENSTQKVMHEGWYITGDIATIDQNGFITIIDRLERISQINGQMISHRKIEELLSREDPQKNFAVTVLEDNLVVFHTAASDKMSTILQKVMPDISCKAIQVDQIPLLGSGKLDLQSLRKIGIERT